MAVPYDELYRLVSNTIRALRAEGLPVKRDTVASRLKMRQSVVGPVYMQVLRDEAAAVGCQNGHASSDISQAHAVGVLVALTEAEAGVEVPPPPGSDEDSAEGASEAGGGVAGRERQLATVNNALLDVMHDTIEALTDRVARLEALVERCCEHMMGGIRYQGMEAEDALMADFHTLVAVRYPAWQQRQAQRAREQERQAMEVRQTAWETRVEQERRARLARMHATYGAALDDPQEARIYNAVCAKLEENAARKKRLSEGALFQVEHPARSEEHLAFLVGRWQYARRKALGEIDTNPVPVPYTLSRG